MHADGVGTVQNTRGALCGHSYGETVKCFLLYMHSNHI